MSWEAVNWATAEMRNPDLTTPEKFVLLILANIANQEGECWPSYQYIQDLTGLASSTVRNACKTIEESGLMTIEKRLNQKGGQTSNMYQLKVPPPLPPTGTPPRRHAAAPLPPTGTDTKEVNREGSKEPISYIRKAGKADPKPAWQASDAELIRLVHDLGRSTIGKSRDELIRILGEQPVKRGRAA